jgi:hypothetical protein
LTLVTFLWWWFIVVMKLTNWLIGCQFRCD